MEYKAVVGLNLCRLDSTYYNKQGFKPFLTFSPLQPTCILIVVPKSAFHEDVSFKIQSNVQCLFLRILFLFSPLQPT